MGSWPSERRPLLAPDSGAASGTIRVLIQARSSARYAAGISFFFRAPRSREIACCVNQAGNDHRFCYLGGEEIACGDDITGSNWSTIVTVTLEACQMITVVVDGFRSEPGGAFGLEVTAS